MKSRTAIVSLTLSFTLAAAALTGCSGAGGGDGKITLEFATQQSTDSPLYTAFQTAATGFMKENPDIVVNIKTGGADYEAQMKVRLAANNPPDLFETHGWSLQRYSPFLAPLQDEAWAENFNEALAPAMKNDKGEFFALPIDTAVSGLVYNETVLEKAGVDPASITSWDALIDASAKVKESGAVPFPLSGPKQGSTGNVVDWLAPGTFSDKQLDDFQDGTFAPDSYQEILDVLDTFRSEGWINPDVSSATSDDVAKLFAQDQAAFVLGTNSLVALALDYAPDAKIQFMPVPALNGSDSYLIGGEDVAIGAAKDGAHVAEAKEFLAYLATPAVAETLVTATGNSSGLSNVTAKLGTLAPSYDAWVTPGDVPLKPFFDRVYLPNGMWNSVLTTADSVVAGQSTPEAATSKVADDFKTLYKKTN